MDKKTIVEIDFEALEKREEEHCLEPVEGLTAFDQRVYEACASLIQAGYESAFYFQIYYEMREEMMKKIENSLNKMRGMPIKVSYKEDESGLIEIRRALLPTEERGDEVYFLYFGNKGYPIFPDIADGWEQLLSTGKEEER